MATNLVNYASVNDNATTAEGTFTVNVKSIALISNDGAASITFHFDNVTTDTDVIVLKAGEQLKDFPQSVSVLHCKAASGVQAFRFIGLK